MLVLALSLNVDGHVPRLEADLLFLLGLLDVNAVEDLFTHLELVKFPFLLSFKECFLTLDDLTVVLLDLLDALGFCSLNVLDV